MRNALLVVTYLLIASGLVLIVVSVVFSLNKRAAEPADATGKPKLEAATSGLDGSDPAGVLAEGSLEKLGVDNLLEVAAAFQSPGFIQLNLPGHRVVIAHFAEGCLTGLTDTGRVWRLGDLLVYLGRLSDTDRKRLLAESEARGVTLGRLVLDEAYLPPEEVESFLRRLAMHSLLLALENQVASTFLAGLDETVRPTVMLPIGDFVSELRQAGAELERLRGLLGLGGGSLGVTQDADPAGAGEALEYRHVEALAQVDGEKTPMELAASSPLPPTETLAILCDLAECGLIGWAPSAEVETATDLELLTSPRADLRPGPAPHRLTLRPLTPQRCRRRPASPQAQYSLPPWWQAGAVAA